MTEPRIRFAAVCAFIPLAVLWLLCEAADLAWRLVRSGVNWLKKD